MCSTNGNEIAGGAECRSHHQSFAAGEVDDLRLAHILVCFAVDPTATIESIPHLPGSLWYVFLQSDDADIERKVEALMAPRNGTVLDYKTNRGLARSWNEGLHLAFAAGCDAVLLVNDDLHFDQSPLVGLGYTSFRSYTANLLRNESDVALITLCGYEAEGRINPQNFSCCIVPKSTVDKIGYFDETFTPAYFEDLDFARRAILSELRVYVDRRCLCEHDRSSTLRSVSPPQQARLNSAIDRNHAYFCAKWGGLFPPTYDRPFNDPKASLEIPLSRTSIGESQRGCLVIEMTSTAETVETTR